MPINAPLDAPLLPTDEIAFDGAWVEIGYGKAAITTYLCDVAPPAGVVQIPESGFTGWPGPLLAAELMVETTGSAFLPSWTTGDNARLVATDTMKNFVLHRASTYLGTTVEGLAAHVGRAMLATYPDMDRLRVTARHLPFAAIGTGGVAHARLAQPGMRTTLSIERTEEGPAVTSVGCGLDGLYFARLRGSTFAGFPRDEYTTLPEASDRPLEIGLSIRWWYTDPADAVTDDLAGWVPPAAMSDLIAAAFERTANRSIQELLTVMARTALERFPSLGRVWIEGENRVWSSPALPRPPDGAPVHTASLPGHGVLRVALSRHPAGR
jgi:urate oxidase / 2-oxo-4-hydroxy-4-carboxy-5-ureidoimidazoline decarboxylase